MKALYFSLALVLCGVLFGTASGCVVDFPDELPYTCEADSDCGGSPHVCASLADGRKYCCKPETELCNRLDDDCNGVPDDVGNDFCYTGPEETRGVGTCRQGRPSCGNGGTVLCGGEVLPTAEVCNGKDDDCDQLTDEGCDEVCRPFTELCDGKDNDCDGQVDEGCLMCPMPGNEICDGKDNDCDGLLDEGCQSGPIVI